MRSLGCEFDIWGVGVDNVDVSKKKAGGLKAFTPIELLLSVQTKGELPKDNHDKVQVHSYDGKTDSLVFSWIMQLCNNDRYFQRCSKV